MSEVDLLVPGLSKLTSYYNQTFLNVCDTCDSLNHKNPVSVLNSTAATTTPTINRGMWEIFCILGGNFKIISFLLLFCYISFFSTDRSYFIPLYYEFMLCTRILFHLHSTYFQCKNTISLLFRRIVRVIFKWPSMQRSNTSIVSLFIKGNGKTQ